MKKQTDRKGVGMETKSFPRIMLAAPGSGSGKTCLTCVLLAALKKRGKRIQAFKCGPDYIDPMFHKTVLGIPSGNLDSWFTDAETTKRLFTAAAKEAELSVIEGVMGYYDGTGGVSLEGSSYGLAEMLEIPVLLVVDCRGMSRSVIALIKGFLEYREKSHIRGVLLNRLSEKQYHTLKEKIEEELRIPVLGFFPPCKELELPSRHLGLVMPEETGHLRERFDTLADRLEKTVEIDGILELAETAGKLNAGSGPETIYTGRKEETPVRVAVARDEAFCFYYEENLRMLEDYGAELVFFSPLHDTCLPTANSMLLGGGYPELYAKALSENTAMRTQIREAAEAGLPILAECGGFLYLQQRLKDMEGNIFPMTGVLAGEGFYTGKLGRFGYVELTDGAGLSIRGHEFHYFDSTENGSAWHAEKPAGGRNWDCMVEYKNVLAGFPHLYYPSCPEFVEEFLKKSKKGH